jgi:hypothetical protein
MSNRRINGGIIGAVNDPIGGRASGIWSSYEQFVVKKKNVWPNPKLPVTAPEWNKTYAAADWNTSGFAATNSGLIYITGADYDGGYKGWASTGTANAGFEALKNSWNLDFRANRDGVNSSPFPAYDLFLSHTYTTGSNIQSNGTNKSIVNLFIGNGYGLYFYVNNGNGSALYSSANLDGSGTRALANTFHRFSFNLSTKTFKYFWAASGGSFSSMTELASYTLTEGEWTSLSGSYDLSYNPGFQGRGNNDGWYGINWYTV